MPAKSLEGVAIAILAKAPVPGTVKTRLEPALGPEGAAQLQAAMIARAADTACAAGLGAVTLWASPDPRHAIFVRLAGRLPLRLARQPEGDLGARMHAAFVATRQPTLVIGTDCPVLTADHLRAAAEALCKGTGCVIIPAEDGGYVLIGLRRPEPSLFEAMTWSVPGVLAETRRRIAASGLTVLELAALWDVDVPDDLVRLQDTDALTIPGYEGAAAAAQDPHA